MRRIRRWKMRETDQKGPVALPQECWREAPQKFDVVAVEVNKQDGSWMRGLAEVPSLGPAKADVGVLTDRQSEGRLEKRHLRCARVHSAAGPPSSMTTRAWWPAAFGSRRAVSVPPPQPPPRSPHHRWRTG